MSVESVIQEIKERNTVRNIERQLHKELYSLIYHERHLSEVSTTSEDVILNDNIICLVI
jgi:hypothetical protein